MTGLTELRVVDRCTAQGSDGGLSDVLWQYRAATQPGREFEGAHMVQLEIPNKNCGLLNVNGATIR